MEARPWRLIQFHENPAVISLWMRSMGPLLSWATPNRRRALLSIGAIAMAGKFLAGGGKIPLPQDSSIGWLFPGAVVAIIFSIFLACYHAAKSLSHLPEPLRGSPQFTLHGIFWISLALGFLLLPREGLIAAIFMGVAAMLPFFLWRLGYLFLSGKRGKVAGTRFRDHLMYLWPLWGGSNTPYGKGLDYLARTEAKDQESLARSQLAGLRLLILAGLWMACKEAMEGAIFGAKNCFGLLLGEASVHLPRLKELVCEPKDGHILLSWAVVYLELFVNVLNRAAKGHLIIGVLRLFGFYVFRNTYKPLLAETVVGFWNRYYYYFKELLVEFFFYPTFAKYFRGNPKMRLFAAVFMAAFVGNMYYHLLSMCEKLLVGEVEIVRNVLTTRWVYCLFLSLGIFVSMMREQKVGRGDAPRRGLRRVGAIFTVWTFFALINIWNQRGVADLESSTKFFLSLLGLG